MNHCKFHPHKRWSQKTISSDKEKERATNMCKIRRQWWNNSKSSRSVIQFVFIQHEWMNAYWCWLTRLPLWFRTVGQNILCWFVHICHPHCAWCCSRSTRSRGSWSWSFCRINRNVHLLPLGSLFSITFDTTRLVSHGRCRRVLLCRRGSTRERDGIENHHFSAIRAPIAWPSNSLGGKGKGSFSCNAGHWLRRR